MDGFSLVTSRKTFHVLTARNSVDVDRVFLCRNSRTSWSFGQLDTQLIPKVPRVGLVLFNMAKTLDVSQHDEKYISTIQDLDFTYFFFSSQIFFHSNHDLRIYNSVVFYCWL